MFLPANTAARLRAAGLTVVEIDGWQTRGRPASTGSFNPVGVLNHHTGSYDGIGDAADDLAYAKWLFLEGRDDLPAPLCGASLSAEGVVYLGAAGRANHAGDARPSGSVAGGDGNTLYFGIEWMLSGLQPIPDKMMQAGAVLNAVMLDILGSSVQAVSCHYNTSVTGKWDIGDPSGISFNGHKVLDVPKFRFMVLDAKRVLNPPKPKVSTLKIVHSSMLAFEPTSDMRDDIEAVFSLGGDIHTGTESSGAKARPMPSLLRRACEVHGYRLSIGDGSDGWVAVKESLITSGWKAGVIPVIPANVGGKHTAKGITWASFHNEEMGDITQGVQHMLLDGKRPGDPNYGSNLNFARAIGDFGRSRGRGTAVVFDNGDQNQNDKRLDTYSGQPFTSGWDEMKHYEPTFTSGSTLDVISSFDRDGRVKCLGIKSLNDREFPLGLDHFPVVARYALADA